MKIPHVYIEDMIEAIEKVQVYLQDITEIQFSRDSMLAHSVHLDCSHEVLSKRNMKTAIQCAGNFLQKFKRRVTLP